MTAAENAETRPKFGPLLVGNYLLVEMVTADNKQGQGLLVTSYITLICEMGDEIHVIAGPDEHTSPRYTCARIPNPITRIQEVAGLARALSGMDGD